MAQAKTRPTSVPVEETLAGIEDPERRADCEGLLDLMRRVTGFEPVMWGTAIVGFGTYRYRYESGRTGESCITGFASRKGEISVYLVAEGARQDQLLARLGRHRMGKACLSIRRLADVDTGVLAQLVAGSVAEVRRRYPET
jgi:hypothetical protein